MPLRRVILAALLASLPISGWAQTASRLRGTVASLIGNDLVIRPEGSEGVKLSLGPDPKITLCAPSTLAAIKPGSFIGTAAKTQGDGTLVAVEVHIFPETMRGLGEGHRPFDLGPTSTMTNGTVGEEVVGTAGRTLVVHYKGGEKSIVVPPDAPVVAFEPTDRSALSVGAHVIAFTHDASGGGLATDRIIVGKDGSVPPL